MLMNIISLETWEPLLDLERLFFEKISYEQLLSYMLSNNISNTNEYFREYQDIIKQYWLLCRRLEQEIILPNVPNDIDITWEVNFIEKYVEVREKTN